MRAYLARVHGDAHLPIRLAWQRTRDRMANHTRRRYAARGVLRQLARRHASVGEWGFLAAWLVAQAAVGRRRSVQGAGLDELEFSKYPA